MFSNLAVLFQETIVEEDIELNDQDLLRQTQPSRSSIEPNVAPPPKKRKPLGPIAKQNELLSLACQYLSSANETSSDDEYLNIAKVWANKMKTLEPNQRMFAEKAINDILFEAQLRTLHKNSVKINELDNRMTLYASSHATDATTSSLSTSTTPLSDFLHLSTQPDESNSDIVIEVPPTGDCNNVRYIFSQFKDN